ncbi:MAG: zinc-binding dehydrogenase [Gammaproteobacteria bacterium]|nr:zinc-binding dehydrogenase [Gammaproteobacteria bacterium]
MGSLVMQIAKSAGAQVIGLVGGEHKFEFAEQFGPDAVIDEPRCHSAAGSYRLPRRQCWASAPGPAVHADRQELLDVGLRSVFSSGD